MTSEAYVKELEAALAKVTEKLREELSAIRGARPSVELVENIKVSYYEQLLPIKQLGSLSIVPPRGVQVAVWDKSAVGAVVKAIEAAQIGLTVSNDGSMVRATLSPLGDERRGELTKLVKKTVEGARIQLRHHRDEAIKKVKGAEEKGELNEDDVFKAKEKIQKAVDDANEEAEKMLEGKLKELSE